MVGAARLEVLDGIGTLAATAELDRVARASFAMLPPEHGEGTADRLVPMLPHEVGMPGFRCVTALRDDAVAGFAAGYITPATLPDSDWWVELGKAVGPDGLEWVLGRFSVVWLAVEPAAQGRGLGSRLLDALSEDQGPAWLVTSEGDTAAWVLYTSRGWQPLGRGRLGPDGRDRVVLRSRGS